MLQHLFRLDSRARRASFAAYLVVGEWVFSSKNVFFLMFSKLLVVDNLCICCYASVYNPFTKLTTFTPYFLYNYSMRKTIYSVYKATCLINQKCYIGVTKHNFLKRKRQHEKNSKKSNIFFHKALKKYGIDNFSWEVVAQTNTLREAFLLESCLIEQHRSYERGYNLTRGGHLTGKCLKRIIRLRLESKINTISDQINFWIKYPFFAPKDKVLRDVLKTFNKKYTKFEKKQNEKIFIKKLEALINTVQDQIDFWLLFPSTVPDISELVTALKERKSLQNTKF